MRGNKSKMVKTVAIFHGYGGKKSDSWLTWLNSELINRSISTIYPSFPPLGSSTIEEWYSDYLKNFDELKRPVIMVGHSAGTVFALYAAQKSNILIEKLILVCPLNHVDGAEYQRPGGEDEASYIRNFVYQKFDFELIKSRVKKFVFLLSENDTKVPYEKTLKYFKNIFPDAKYVTLKDSGHVNEKAGITELPVVLEETLK